MGNKSKKKASGSTESNESGAVVLETALVVSSVAAAMTNDVSTDRHNNATELPSRHDAKMGAFSNDSKEHVEQLDKIGGEFASRDFLSPSDAYAEEGHCNETKISNDNKGDTKIVAAAANDHAAAKAPNENTKVNNSESSANRNIDCEVSAVEHSETLVHDASSAADTTGSAELKQISASEPDAQETTAAQSDQKERGSATGGETVTEKTPGSDEETTLPGMSCEDNFTWEHFFVEHCGILREDALFYEKGLIDQRLDPVNTLLESVDLIVEYGRIPVGDKLIISKRIDREIKALEAANRQTERAKEKLGLKEYSDAEAKLIIGLGGGTKNYEIDYGIERYEDMQALMADVALGNQEAFRAGASLGMEVNSDAMTLLRAFGYKTFDYTKGKEVPPASAHASRGSAMNITPANGIFGAVQRQQQQQPTESSLMLYS